MSDQPTQEPAVQGPSAGQLLKQAREAAGLHVATLAVALKVPVRKLEALEADRYEELPDAVFARALASSVCRHLKIDPQPVLERLPQGTRPRLASASQSINAPFRAPGDGPGPNWTDQLKRPVSLMVMALLLGALAIMLWPAVRPLGESPAATTTMKAEPVMPPGSPTTVALAPTEPVTVPASAPAPSSLPEVAAAPSSKPSAPASAVVPARSTASAAAAPDANSVIAFKARSASWIQVVDGKGNMVLRRVLDAGETVGVGGALPLSVIVGSAEATTVEVRGKPFNLQPVTRDNVARFEVK